MCKQFLRALALALPAVLVITLLVLAGGSDVRSAVFALLKLAVTR